MNNELKKQAFQ